MAKLSEYRRKRDFGVTAEPSGKTGKKSAKAARFVVQRHDATRLHYDFRIELDGVYKSWAVTKLPSGDPAVKRLAVEVEDHPLDYGSFEGTIPKGQYGGGTVQLWDRGHWIAQSDGDPLKALKAGHLKMVLDGERMKGGWALIRLRDKAKRPGKKVRHNWLLIKEKDDYATPGEEEALAAGTSIKTGRTLEEIAQGKKKTAARKKKAKTAVSKKKAVKARAQKKSPSGRK